MNDHRRSAVIQIASSGNEPKRTVACTMRGMQGKRLGVDAAEQIAISAAVSVEYNDALFLGEVLRCSQNESGSWDIEIKVEQILTGLQSLIKLRARLIGEEVPQPVKFAPVTVYS